MRLARFAGGVIDQCVGQRHAVAGEIEAGRVDTIQWIERGPDHARYAEGIEDMDRAEACAIVGDNTRVLALGVDADDRARIRSEGHTSELTSLMRTSYVVCFMTTKTIY